MYEDKKIDYESEVRKRLDEDQIKNLQKSGLSYESIYKAGYKKTIIKLGKDHTCTAIFYANPLNGNHWLTRYRFNTPVNGKRYHQDKGTKVYPYCSQQIDSERWREGLSNPIYEGVMIEGEKKADSFIQHSHCKIITIALSGVWGWSKGNKQLNDFLDQYFAIKGRKITLIFDSDSTGNPNILNAIYSLAEILIEKGCEVNLIIVPGDPDNPEVKYGLDDYLVQFTEEIRTEKLEELLKKSKRLTKKYIAEQKKEIKSLAKVKKQYRQNSSGHGYRQVTSFNKEQIEALDQMDLENLDPIFDTKMKDEIKASCLARIIVKEKKFLSENVGGKDICYIYDKNHWKFLNGIDLRHMVEGRFTEASTNKIRKYIYEEIKDISFKENIPWRTAVTEYEILLRDHVVDCLSDQVREHRAEDYITSVVQVDGYDPNETITTPLWDKFLENACQTSEGVVDPDKITLLHELIGFFLTQRYLIKKFVIFKGEKDTGKTLISKILKDLIGPQFVTAFKIHKMEENFGLELINNKLLAIDSEPQESEDKRKINKGVSGALIKQLTGGEEDIAINTKYKSQESKVNFAKLLILTNKIPLINDDTGIAFERMVILTFDKTMDKPDLKLHQKLKAEYRGIVHRSIKAFSKAAKRFNDGDSNGFTMPVSSELAILEYKNTRNVINLFCSETLIKTDIEIDFVIFSQFYERFQMWGKAQTPKVKMSLQAFAKSLSKAGYKTIEKRIPANNNEKSKRSCMSPNKPSKKPTMLVGYKFKDSELLRPSKDFPGASSG